MDVDVDMQLVRPSREHLPGYVDALRRGWSPRTDDPSAAGRTLAEIDADADAFLAGSEDRDPVGRVLVLADGSQVPRLPQLTRWMWDGDFAGSIGVRWQAGTTDLPPTCLGHIGYSVVPWRRRLGYATRALALMLPIAAAEGLPFVDITTDPDNVASQRVILANGGVLVGAFTKPEAHGGGPALRYVVRLS